HQRQRALGGKSDACVQHVGVDDVAVEVGIACIYADWKRQRLEEREERPQLMLDHQRMPLSTACRRQQHRLADESVLSDEIEEMLEESGERRAVHRAADDQQISVFN